MFEFFIAKRYLKSKHKLNFIAIISIFSTLGITIGVAALVIVLSVFNGFGSLVTSILINFDPHIRITFMLPESTTVAEKVSTILEKNKKIKSFYPYIEEKSILINKQNFEIVSLKGVTKHKADESWGVKENIISGNFDISNPNGIPKIILGLPTALNLSARVGDTITVSSANSIQQSAINFSVPNNMRFIVSGIFEINNKQYASKFAYTSLYAAEQTFAKPNRISGFELRLTNISYSGKVKKELEASLKPFKVRINTWYDLHKDLYSVMLIERWSAYILLSLIIAIATFNILGSLTMTVLEKRKDIGVLRSMGTPKKSILKIFMFDGMLIGLIGTIAGIAIGLLVCYLQINYNFYPLDPTKYIINAMPVQVRFTDILAIGGMSFFLTWLASLYPAKRAVKTNIIEAIKWE